MDSDELNERRRRKFLKNRRKYHLTLRVFPNRFQIGWFECFLFNWYSNIHWLFYFFCFSFNILGDVVCVQEPPYSCGEIRSIKFKEKGLHTKYLVPIYQCKFGRYTKWYEEYELGVTRPRPRNPRGLEEYSRSSKMLGQTIR